MGGGWITPPSTTSEEESSEDQDSSWFLEDGTNNEDNEVGCGQLDQVGSGFSSSSPLEFEADRRRKYSVYNEVLQSYDQLRIRSESLNEAKSKILSYLPGAWIGNRVGTKLSDYNVPETTTLVLIGPKGCGKSSLVNTISRVLEDDKFAPERAQVSYNSSVGDGTSFLQEYMVPRYSSSFCLYDTRSLSDDPADNIDMIMNWMTKGLCHGELVLRKSDASSVSNIMKRNTREKNCQSNKVQMVNFVIFVVDGVAVLKSMEGDGTRMTQNMQIITTAFDCPYLSFKDDKPVLVVTHGDLLSLADRVWVRVHLGELLGIPPAKQIFDIPANSDAATELTVVDMIRYSLEHADRNLPLRNVKSSYQTIHQEGNLQNKFEDEKKTDEGKGTGESSNQIILQGGNLHSMSEKEKRTDEEKRQNKESSYQTIHKQGNIINQSGKEKKSDKGGIVFYICVVSCVIFALVITVFIIKDESEPPIDCMQNNEVKHSKYLQELARRNKDENGATRSHIIQRNTDPDERRAEPSGRAIEMILSNQSEEREKAEGKNEEYRKVGGERYHVAAIGLDYASLQEVFRGQERVEGIAELARRIRGEDGAIGSHIPLSQIQGNTGTNERGAELSGRAMEKIIGNQFEEREKAENMNREYGKVSGKRNHVAAIGLGYASAQEFFGDEKRVEGIAVLTRRIRDEHGATESHIVQTNTDTNEKGALPKRVMENISGPQSKEIEKAENMNEEYMKANGERNHAASIGLDYVSLQELLGDHRRVEGIVELASRTMGEYGATGNESRAKLPGRVMEKITGNQSKEMEKAENRNDDYVKVDREGNHVAAIALDYASVQFFSDQDRVGWIAQPIEKKVGKEKNEHKEIDGKRDNDKGNDHEKKRKFKRKDRNKGKKKEKKTK